MNLTNDDLAAIREQIDAALDARGLQRQSALVETSADSAITFAQGGLIRTQATDALLPGVSFATWLARGEFSSPADLAFIRANCGLKADGSPDPMFGQLFAQQGSAHDNPLQGLTTPQLYGVVWSPVFGDYVRNMNRPIGKSSDLFPDFYACRFSTWAQLTEWCRLTREDWLGRGWVPGN